MDLKPKGGGVSLGENMDLCTIPYGAFGPRGGGAQDIGCVDILCVMPRSWHPSRVCGFPVSPITELGIVV